MVRRFAGHCTSTVRPLPGMTWCLDCQAPNSQRVLCPPNTLTTNRSPIRSHRSMWMWSIRERFVE